MGTGVGGQEACGGGAQERGDTGVGQRGTMQEDDPAGRAQSGGLQRTFVRRSAWLGQLGEGRDDRRFQDEGSRVGRQALRQAVGVRGPESVGQPVHGQRYARRGAEGRDGALDDGVQGGLRVTGPPSWAM